MLHPVDFLHADKLVFAGQFEYTDNVLVSILSRLMIRRILVMLALLFVVFFTRRRIDRASADKFLNTVRNFSFQNDTHYTTTVHNPDGTTTVYDQNGNPVLGTTGLKNIITDTLSNKSQTGTTILDEILNPETLSDAMETSGALTPETETETTLTGFDTIIYIDGLPAQEGGSVGGTEQASTSSSKKYETTLSDQDRRQVDDVVQGISFD